MVAEFFPHLMFRSGNF